MPLKPIVAAYNAPSYKLAKFLIGFIQHLAQSLFTLDNSYEFEKVLENHSFPKDVYIASFDALTLIVAILSFFSFSCVGEYRTIRFGKKFKERHESFALSSHFTCSIR